VHHPMAAPATFSVTWAGAELLGMPSSITEPNRDLAQEEESCGRRDGGKYEKIVMVWSKPEQRTVT